MPTMLSTNFPAHSQKEAKCVRQNLWITCIVYDYSRERDPLWHRTRKISPQVPKLLGRATFTRTTFRQHSVNHRHHLHHRDVLWNIQSKNQPRQHPKMFSGTFIEGFHQNFHSFVRHGSIPPPPSLCDSEFGPCHSQRLFVMPDLHNFWPRGGACYSTEWYLVWPWIGWSGPSFFNHKN